MALKTDYNVLTASSETKEAMADRCHTQGHDWENCCSVVFRIFMRCRWCGEER